MPAIGATDPADIMAQARREAGLSRQVEQTRRVLLRLTKGSSGYPPWFRADQLDRHQNNQPIDVSDASISRWSRRLLPYRQTGNRDRTQLVGVDLINLVLFIIAHPDAHIDEMAVFIYNEGGSSTVLQQFPSG